MIEAPLDPLSEAPDVPGVVVAWRVWRLVSVEGICRLVSAFRWSVWQPEQPLVAHCFAATPVLSRLRRRSSHDAPEATCRCGIYGTDLGLVDTCLAALRDCRELGRVLGEVSLWGTVVECERGYRASKAYPRRIYIPADATRRAREEVAADLAVYGVPVDLLDARCSEAAVQLGHRIAA